MGSFPATTVAADSSGLVGVAATQPVDPGTTTNLTWAGSSSFDGNGTEYTGSNGYTVTDSYSCGSGACGGFTMGSFPATTVAADSSGLVGVAATQPVDPGTTTNLFSGYTDSTGYTYTGSNGYTVTDSYSCTSGSCGGFTMGSFPAGDVSSGAVAPSQGLAMQALPIDPACSPDPNGSCFSVVDPQFPEGSNEGFTVWTNAYEGKVAALAPAPAVVTNPAMDEMSSQKAGDKEKPCKPHFSHYVLCGHAMVLGAITATANVGGKMLEGKKVEEGAWQAEFSKTAEEAVKSVTPVGGYILTKQVFGK